MDEIIVGLGLHCSQLGISLIRGKSSEINEGWNPMNISMGVQAQSY